MAQAKKLRKFIKGAVINNGEYPPGVFFPKRSKNLRPLKLPGENFRTPYFHPQKFNTPYSASKFKTPYFPSQKFNTPYPTSKFHNPPMPMIHERWRGNVGVHRDQQCLVTGGKNETSFTPVGRSFNLIV